MREIPLVSVLMPVFNCELYITEAVESVLHQTYKHFELLIFDDASNDRTVSLIESFHDSRISLFKKEKNTGYTNSLIMGMTAAQGKYIARMDSDDVCHPERFYKQVEFLEKNPQYGLVGSQLKTITSKENVQYWNYPISDVDIRLYTIINSPLVHPSVMIRKDVLEKNQLNYDANYEPCEDYKLWVDLLKVTKAANLSEVLLYYRLHQTQTIITKRNLLLTKSNIIRKEVIASLFNQVLTENEVLVHYHYFNEIGTNNIDSIKKKYQWRRKMREWFSNSSFKKSGIVLVEKYWIINVRTLTEFNPSFFKFLFNRYLMGEFSSFEIVKFALKCLISYKVRKTD